MKTVIYDGPHDAVSIPLSSGIVATCERGGSVAVPDDVAGRLVEQDGWTFASPPAKAQKTTTKTIEEEPDADR